MRVVKDWIVAGGGLLLLAAGFVYTVAVAAAALLLLLLVWPWLRPGWPSGARLRRRELGARPMNHEYVLRRVAERRRRGANGDAPPGPQVPGRRVVPPPFLRGGQDQ